MISLSDIFTVITVALYYNIKELVLTEHFDRRHSMLIEYNSTETSNFIHHCALQVL